MSYEYWSHDFGEWRRGRGTHTLEWVTETNRLLGWEMYREAE